MTFYLPTVRRLARVVLKYGAGAELSRLARSESAAPVGLAIAQALFNDFSAAESDAIAAIEAIRSDLNRCEESIEMRDFGAGSRGEFSGAELSEGRLVTRRIGELSRESSADPFWARVLFFLIRNLKPQRCVELGGLVGISSAYQAAALRINMLEESPDESTATQPQLVVMEGDPTLSDIIRGNLCALSLDTVTSVVTGRFADTLSAVVSNLKPVDFAFVDGHHDGDATVRYFEQIRPHLAPGALVVIDDVAWSSGMRSAWHAISRSRGVAVAVWAQQFGVVRISNRWIAPSSESSKRRSLDASIERPLLREESRPVPEFAVLPENDAPDPIAQIERFRLWLV